MGSSGSSLKVRSYEMGKVYMFNFPSTRECTSPSPYCLKLETWLRLKKIPHEVIRTVDTASQKGQKPFIEYNGEEYSDSNLIIDFLAKEFDKRDELTEEQRGLATCVSRVVDNRTPVSYGFSRYAEYPKESMEAFEFISPMKKKFLVFFIAPMMVRRNLKARGFHHFSPEEIHDIGFQDIAAVSALLGSNRFLMGDSITTVDCTVFAHLAQIRYSKLPFPHKEFMQQHAANVCEYLDRVKEAVWPDWDQVCEQNLQAA